MREIQLIGKWCRFAVLVDDEDFGLLSKHKWYGKKKETDATIYACATIKSPNGRPESVWMHRLILGLHIGDEIHTDHINSDGLDNQKSNLRKVTRFQNEANRRGAQVNSKSGIRGVRWHIRDKRWTAQICSMGKIIHLGSFTTLKEATVARRVAGEKYHREYAGKLEG